MKRIYHITLSLVFCQAVMAQQTCLTVADCMRYAVEHNHDIRISQLTQDSRRAEHTEAIGAFLPAISGNIGAQYNFGRAIDPETNTYTNVSTFYNGYSLSASLPVFDGFQRLNHLRAAKASILMGNSQIQAQRDELALKVYEAYCNVLYFQGTVQMTREKRNQSQMTLRQTQVMCEVGQKSEADVAQMEAQLAADEYEITRQENELKTAMLTLRQLMGMETLPPTPPCMEGSDYLQEEDFTLMPIDDIMNMEATEVSTSLPTGRDKRESLLPSLQAAELNVNVARHQLNVAKGALSPSLSINGGVSTSFNKMLHAEATPFRDQLKNNKGEYVYASVSIPLFNRMQTLTNIRRQRNNLRIAEEQLAQKREELTKLQLQAAYDCEGYRKQTLQMEEKVEADSLASQLTTRQYEEGLASGIDVQTTSATLLKSRAQLLQCRLMWALKQKLVNYYQGIPLL